MRREKWDEGWEGVPAARGARRAGEPGTVSRKWWPGDGPSGQKWDMFCEKWDEESRGGSQWNWAVSVEPARARVALSGLSAVETTSK